MYHATGLPRWARGFPGFGPATPENEATALRDQADWLQSRLDAIRARLGQTKKD